MAKKKFDFGIAEETQTQPSRKKKDLFDNPLEQIRLGRQKASRVAGRKTDGSGRIRKTIFLDPIAIDEIEKVAASEGFGKMDFYEWLILIGLQQFDEGVRPEVESQPIIKSRIKIDR